MSRNIFLRENNSIVLGDFGLAYLAIDMSDEIQIDFAGTLGYASLESLNDVSRSFNEHAKSDVW